MQLVAFIKKELLIMHIPDGYLSPTTCGVMYATAIPFWAVAVKRVRKELTARTVPVLALFSAFSFTLMMFNVPIPGGTTAHAVPFELIVAAGPNSALPHAKPSEYVIKNNEPIVIDIGSKVEFYGSDLTRTVYLGKPDETFKKVYSTVLEAQQTAIANIKPGMTGTEADTLARQVIEKAGYGDTFGHSLGHGIGLITHEKPTVGPNSTDILTEGMVFTIEPGIYISGWGGVRIEDDVAIQNGKLRVISSGRKLKV